MSGYTCEVTCEAGGWWVSVYDHELALVDELGPFFLREDAEDEASEIEEHGL